MMNRDMTVGDGAPIKPDVLTDKPLEDALKWVKSLTKPKHSHKNKIAPNTQ